MKSLVVIALTVFSFSSFAQSQQQDSKAIGAVEKAAAVVAAKDLSCQRTSDCEVLEIGSRACGGPSSYLVASIKNQDHASLVAIAKLTVDLEHAYNQRYGVISTCIMLMPSTVSCVAGKCQTIR